MDKNLVVIRDLKTIYFDFYWPKDLNLEIKFIIKNNESLAENQIKSETERLTKSTENSKTNEPHEFFLNLSPR